MGRECILTMGASGGDADLRKLSIVQPASTPSQLAHSNPNQPNRPYRHYAALMGGQVNAPWPHLEAGGDTQPEMGRHAGRGRDELAAL